MPVPPFLDLFDEIVLLLLVAAALGALAVRLRQPLILGFIAAGILIGPSGFGFVRASDRVHVFAELGIALLLFVVGLKLDLHLIRRLGTVALAVGGGQVFLTAVIGYAMAAGLGMDSVTSLYVGIAVAFSSTIIVIKLLSDKRETESLHGQIAVGILIVQDILVIVAMITLAGFAVGGNGDPTRQILLLAINAAAFLLGLGLVMYFVLPRLVSSLARSPELLVLFALAWALGLASLSESLGFSKEVGAFLAGVSLASTPYREMLGAKLVSLRDFLLLFFFLELGTSLDVQLIGGRAWAAIPLSIFVLLGKPLIIMGIMGLMGYRKHTSFLTGSSLGQISEFSLILAALGLQLGHIDAGSAGLLTLIGLITIGISSYIITNAHNIYERLAPYLSIFERPVRHPEQITDTDYAAARKAEVVLFGLGRYGGNVARQLIMRGRTLLGVDFDPQAVKRWRQQGFMAWYGDAEDPEFPAMLHLSGARWVVSTIRDRHISLALLHALQGIKYMGNIALTANSSYEAETLRNAGADVVFVPYSDAASQAVDVMDLAEQQETRRKMDKLIAGLKDHYIVCGYGRMGQQIAKDFQRHGVPFVVIEWNPEQFPRLIEHEVPYVEGKATEDEMLLKAGAERARGLIAVTATDEENVFIVLTARGLNPNLYILARSILEENEDKLKRAGADKVMSPYILGGRRMAAAVLKPRVMDFLDLVIHEETANHELADITVSPSAPFVNKTIRDSSIRQTTGVLILAIRHGGDEMTINPSPDFVINENDELFVMGTSDEVDNAERLAAGQSVER